MVQKLLFRVLRPYWWQQQQINRLLIDSIRDATRVASSEPLEAIKAVWTEVHMLEAGMPLERQRTTRVEASVSKLDEALATLQQALAQRTKTVTDLSERLTGFEAALFLSRESAEAFQMGAATHLKALTDQLAGLTTQIETLSSRLYAVPYMNDPDRFILSDGEGRRVLGFRSKRDLEGGTYLGFEDIFRGNEAFIRDRLGVYLPILQTSEHVIEIGCGRGEFLDLLRENGVSAAGVDIDEAMVRRCRAKGHSVELMNGLSYLEAQADSTVSTIFSAQVVEHLTYEELLRFIRLSFSKLKPGGRLIFETMNPHCLEAFKTFWTDLTHQRPIFPEVALAWCWLHGFQQAYVIFPNGVGALTHDRVTVGEYAVVATKAGALDEAGSHDA